MRERIIKIDLDRKKKMGELEIRESKTVKIWKMKIKKKK